MKTRMWRGIALASASLQVACCSGPAMQGSGWKPWGISGGALAASAEPGMRREVRRIEAPWKHWVRTAPSPAPCRPEEFLREQQLHGGHDL